MTHFVRRPLKGQAKNNTLQGMKMFTLRLISSTSMNPFLTALLHIVIIYVYIYLFNIIIQIKYGSEYYKGSRKKSYFFSVPAL